VETPESKAVLRWVYAGYCRVTYVLFYVVDDVIQYGIGSVEAVEATNGVYPVYEGGFRVHRRDEILSYYRPTLEDGMDCVLSMVDPILLMNTPIEGP
jgi:hypothetical protein